MPCLQQLNKMGLKWTVLLFLGALLSCGSCLDWQGAGNITQDSLTTIRAKIFALSPTASFTAIGAFTTTLSKELNTLWAPAWNVVIILFMGANYDAVLYGYGFNGHWFWFNGFKVNSGYLSFIIWKDFNCVTWTNFDPFNSNPLTFTRKEATAISNTIQGGAIGRDLGDIWLAAQYTQAKFPTASNTILNNKLAYTVIATASFGTLFGKFWQVLCKEIHLSLGSNRSTLQRRQPYGICSRPSNEAMIVNTLFIIKGHYHEQYWKAILYLLRNQVVDSRKLSTVVGLTSIAFHFLSIAIHNQLQKQEHQQESRQPSFII